MDLLPRVLIVDDEPHICDWFATLMELMEYEVVGMAYDGEQALSAYQELSPNLVLLDISIPKMSGTEVLKRIHTINQDALIIMVTSHNTMQMVTDCLNNGASNFILKTNEQETIMHSIRDTWDHYCTKMKQE